MNGLNCDRTRVMFVGFVAAFAMGGLTQAATITVGPPRGGYHFHNIQDGIDAANDGDEVLVTPGEYVITTSITFKGKAITVRSEAGPEQTIIRIAPDYDFSWIVIFDNGEDSRSLLEGFTITGSPERGVSCVDSSPRIENCVMMANWESGIQCLSSSPIINNCIITGSVGDSGINCRENSSPTITNCTIWGNMADGSGGGGIYCNDSSPTIIDCLISENEAGAGGGVQCINNSSPTMINCTISDNSAAVGGGMHNVDDSHPTLSNCTFSENSAEDAGGGMYNDAGSCPTLSNCTISGNSVVLDGGGMYNGNSSPTLINCTFSGNHAENGGGMGNDNESNPELSNCVFSNNFAERGGGMDNDRISSPTLTNCTFSGNSADVGGGVHNNSCSSTITNCTFSSNSADVVGGAMFNLDSSELTITNCTFSDNSAGWGGGGMWNEFTNASVTGCMFSGNSAENGGAISNNESSSTKLINCTFSGNSAENGGGISNNEDSSPTVTNCILWGNTAPSGAQIYNDEMSSTMISYSCIQGYVEPSEPEIQGLISRWQFDEGEGNTAYDSASNNHGIIYGEAEWTTGIIGGALDFDGYNSYVSLPIDSVISSLTNSTFATWVNWSGQGAYWQRCWDFGSSERVNMFLTTQNSYTGTPRFAITTTGNRDEDQTTAPDALSDGWHHLAVTIDVGNSTHSLYLDGELVDENTFARYTPSDLGSTTQNWLGRSQYSADPYLEGRLDDVRLYDRALSDKEIERLYRHDFGGHGNIDADPMFVEPDSNDFHLLPGSPCIDAGDNTAVPAGVTTDLDGNPRISGPAVDMGAYEHPFVLFVDVDAAGADDGSSWEDAFNHLQDAIALASISPAEIRVAEGTYTPAPPGGDREATFQLVSGVAVKGGYAGYGEPDPDARDIELHETILSGDLNGDDGPDFANNGENSYHVVTGSNCDQMAILDGLTITAGNAFESRGGGMFNENGSPTLTNCTFSGNSASPLWGEGPDDEPMFGEGGGMFSEGGRGGSPTLTDCTFSRNVACYGGGMHNENSDPTLTNCTFSENEAGEFGGGMNNKESSPRLTSCTFSGNSTGRAGGGMSNKFSNPIVTNCTFSRNSGSEGGGMYNEYGNPIVTNCTFSTNSGFDGGGMYNRSSNPIVTSCTFSGNSGGYGGGMSAGVDEDGASDLTITNCTFNGNSAEYVGGGMFIGWDLTMTITNCTFNGNSAEYGGGIDNNTYRLTITNCILWGNTARTGPQISDAFGPPSPTTVTYSDVQGGWPGKGNIDADPRFADADGADNIVGTEDDIPSLLPGSACADAGNNDAVPPDVIFDLYGDPRFADDPYAPDTGHGTAPIVDIGAYEGAKPSFVLSTQSVAVPEGQTEIFTVALALEPAGTVQVNVTFQSGDPDITVQSSAVLTFDPADYSVPQTVVLAAAEDEDQLNDTAIIGISAPGFINCGVTATELDNESNPNTLFVDASATGTNNGENWPNAFTDLQEALHLAAEYPQFEQVLVGEGVYTPAPPEGNPGATFQLVSGVAVYGGFPTGGGSWQDRDPDAHKTILSGDLNGDDGPDFANNSENSRRVVTSEGTSETTVLNGFTITGSRSIGMYNLDYASPTITNCIFSANADEGMSNHHYSSPMVTDCVFSANAGGGMRNQSDCSPTISNCTFSGNSGGAGGGMNNNNGGSPTVTNCTFSGNSARSGGGIYNVYGSNPTVTNCTFTGNSAEEVGGGMCNRGSSSSSSSFTNCIFSGNSAGTNGGGIYNRQGSPSLTNCTFSGNSAGFGGGIYIELESSPIIINCAFSGNSALNGNDCACDSLNQRPSNIEITNCILWSGGQEIWDNDGSTITISYTDLQNGQAACFDPCNAIVWSMGNIDDDPLFIDASSGDLHLLPGSPCIDAGDPLSHFGLEPEPDGGRINMGAYGNTPEATCKGGLVLKSYNMVSKVRSGRTTFSYEFTVTLNNNSTADVYNVQLEMLDTSGNVVMLDSEVNFAYIAAGETATSEDTFSLSVDRAIPIDVTTISWRAQFESGTE